MQTSDAVRSTMLRFYGRVSASDVGGFDELVSNDPATLVIGAAPGEWVTEPARLRYGFEAEGLRIEAGPDPIGWQEGSAGLFVDEPTYFFPVRIEPAPPRLTAVLHRRDDRWKSSTCTSRWACRMRK